MHSVLRCNISGGERISPWPGHFPGIVHTALAVGGFAIGTTEFAAMSLEPNIAVGLGIDAPTAGHVISAYALGVVVGAPLLAVLSAKLARRTLLIVLMLMFAIGNGLSAMARLSLDAGLPIPERIAARRLFRDRGAGRGLARPR